MAFGDTIVAAVLGGPATPQDNDAANNSVTEGAAVNTPVGITVFAKDNLAVTYSLTADSSGGGFKIDPNTGLVTVADSSKIDFESSAGHAYTITVRAFDGVTSSAQTFTIGVNDVAPSAPVDANAAANTVLEGAAAGTAVGITASSADVNGPAVTYSLIGDTSGGGFTINATTGVVTVADGSKIDFESSPGHAYTVTVQSSDGTLTSSQAFTINVGDVAMTTPVDANAAANAVAEGAAAGTTVGITASATDPSGPATTYSLIGDTSGGGFTINAATGVVTVANPAKIDFESSGAGHSYNVTVQASNGVQTTSQVFTVGVTDVAPSTPTDSNGAANTVVEGAANGTVVGVTAASSDVNGPAVTYSLTGDTSGGGFTINAATGVITVADSTKIDYETAAGHAYTVAATASDGTLTSSQTFTIAVTDVAPSAPTDSNLGTNTVAEGAANGSTVGITASSSDVNGPAVTYSLTGDTSNGGFTINSSTGVVTVADATKIDYESSGAGHNYTVTATASDGTLSSSQTFNIAVTDVAPSTPTDLNIANNTIAEGAANGSTVGITASSTDVNGPAVTYSLTDNAGGRFAIDPNSGVVTVANGSAIDFETASGHAYSIIATASDGTLTNSQTFSIGVADVAPSTPTDGDPAANAVAEGAANGTAVGFTASSTDVNGPAVTYSLSDDAGGRFAINSTTGAVTVANGAAIDYETAPSHAYSITATASDGTLTSSSTVTIGVTDVAPATPTDGNNATNTVAEGSGAGTLVGVTASSTDVNGPEVSYSFADIGGGVLGNAGGLFQIDSSTGIVSVSAFGAVGIDYESAAGHSYSVTVQASDRTLTSAPQTFTIAVSNVAPSAPVDGDSVNPNTVTEGVAAGNYTGLTAASTDPNSPASAVTYSLTDDAGGRFAIDSSTGAVSTGPNANLIDFETAAGHAYSVTVRASDSSGAINDHTDQTFTIAVANANPSTPVDGDTGTANSILEGLATGASTGLTVQATDPGGTAVTYTLTDDAGGRFQILDPTTGVVTAGPNADLIDFESSGGSYNITAQASDGAGGISSQTFTIAVADAAPASWTDQDAGADTVVEGAANTTAVGVTAHAIDPNGGTVHYSIVAGNANGAFAIDAASGVITVADGTKVDFESTAGSGHTYTLTVQGADDNNLSTTQDFVIDVTNAAPSTPVDNVAPTGGTVLEGAAAGATVGITALSVDPGGTGAVTYSLTNDAGGFFTIDSGGVVTVTAAGAAANGIDYESSGAGHSYGITVDAFDGTVHSAQNFTIAVQNVAPSQPVEADGSTANDVVSKQPLANNGDQVGITLSSSDPHGGAVTYSLTDDTGTAQDGGGLFTVNPTTGVVTVANNALLTSAAVGDTFTIYGRASDGTDFGLAQGFTVTVISNTLTLDLNGAGGGGNAGAGFAATYTEQGSAVAIADTDDVITNTGTPGANTIVSAKVVLTDAKPGDAFDVSGVGAGFSPTVVSNAGTITVTLSGSDTFAHYATALQHILFSTAGDAPDTADRHIDVTVNDGTTDSNAAQTVISVQSVNDAPTLSLTPSTAVSYTENGGPLQFFTSGTVSDPDAPANFASGSYTVAITNPDTGDQIVLLAMSGFTTSGSSVIFGGNTVGTATGLGTATVTVTFNSSATPAVVSQLSDAFAFQSSSENPSTTDRHVTFTFNDGGNSHTDASGPLNSNVVHQTVHVAAVNDAPVNHVPAGALNVTENHDFIIHGLSVSDVDSAAGTEVTTLSVTGGTLSVDPAGGAAVAGSGTNSVTLTGTVAQINTTLSAMDNVVYHPLANSVASDTLVVNTNDNDNTGTGDPLSDTDTVAINITSASALDGQLWYVTRGGVASDDVVGHLNSDGSGIAHQNSTPVYNDVGVDTAAGLYFTVDGSDLSSHLTADGSVPTGGTVPAGGDQYTALAVDTVNHLIYVGVTCSSPDETGIAIFTYDPNAFQPDGVTANPDYGVLGNTGQYLLNQTSAPGLYANGADFTLDIANQKLYYVDDDGSTTNTIYVVDVPAFDSTQASGHVEVATPTPVTSSAFFTPDGANGFIEAAAVDAAHHLVYFLTVNPANANAGTLWYVDTTDPTHTAALVTVPAGSLVESAHTGLTFDSVSGDLFVSNQDAAGSAILQGHVDPSTHTIAGFNTYTADDLTGGTGSAAVPGATAFDVLSTLNAADTAFKAGGPAVALDPALAVIDPDGYLSSVTITTSGGFTGDLDQLTYDLTGTSIAATPASAVADGSGNVTLTLTGYDTVAHYQQVLRSVTFSSSAADPTDGGAHTTRTINWHLDDGAPTNLAGINNTTTTLHIALDAAPTLDLDNTNPGNDYTTNFSIGGTAVAIASTHVDIADTDDTNMASATVVLTTGDASDSLLINGAMPSGISASITSGVGTITVSLTGSASTAAYDQALSQILFTTADPNPAPASRTIDVVVSDGTADSIHATSTVTITSNPAPQAADDTGTASEAGGVNNATGGSHATGNVITGPGPGTDVDPNPNPSAITVVSVAKGTEAAPVGGSSVSAGSALVGQYGTLTLNSDGSYTYVIDDSNTTVQGLRTSGQTLTDSFNYTIQDAFGASNTASDGGAHTNSIATLAITITGTNDNPVAVADTASATEAGVIANSPTPGVNAPFAGVDPSGTVFTNDTDVDAPNPGNAAANGETKTVVGAGAGVTGTITGGTGVNTGLHGNAALNYGTFTVHSDGTYTYAVNQANTAVQALRQFSDTLTDTFSYTLSDTAGATSTTQIVVTIHGQNDAPVANNDAANAQEQGGTNNGSGGFNPTGNVLTAVGGSHSTAVADTDVDSGDTQVVQGVEAGSHPTDIVTTGVGAAVTGTYGSLTVNSNGSFSYTLNNSASNVQALTAADHPTDTFTYTMHDTAGATSTAVVTVTVDGANDAPVAANDGTYVVLENRTTSPVTAPGLLANDTDVDAGTTLTAVKDTNSVHGGTVTVNANGTFSIAYAAASNYLGADTFTYHANDGSLSSASATVTVDVQPLVWHIDNTAAAGGDGSAAHPFNSIAAFNTANAAAGTHPDLVYLHFGSGTYSEADGVNLNSGQSLIGQGSALTYQTSASSPGGVQTVTLIAADPAHTPTIQVTGATGQGVTLAQNNTLQGFHIDTSTNAGAIGIEDSNAAGAAGSVGTLNVSNVDITGAGKAIDIDQGGTLNVSLNSITSTGSNSEGIQLGGIAGTNTIGGSFAVTGATSVTNATGNAIQVLNTAASASFNFGNTTVNDTVVGGHTGNGINLLTGIGTTNSFSFSNLADTTDGGFGLAASGGTINIGGTASTINATGGAAVDLTNTSLGTGATFATVSSTNSTGTGIQITGLSTGNFTANGGTISNPTGTDVSINGGTSNITYNGSISDDVGQLVSVANKTGGTVAFGGSITDLNNGTGNGISLTGNTGATINFTGGTTLSTGANNAFTATGGGTVNVTGTNHLTTTTGTALNISNTNIGASNVTFQDISSNGGSANGIILDTTGSAGGLHVTGTGTAGSGGTIANKTGADASTTQGAGIYLNSTAKVQLNDMNLHDFQNFGIFGNTVNSFDLTNSTVNATGSSTATNGTQQGNPNNESSILFKELTGTANITNDTIADGETNDLAVLNNASGTSLTLNVSGSTFTGRDNAALLATVQEVLLVAGANLGDTPNITANFINNTMTNNDARDLQAVANGAATMTINIGQKGVANSGGTFNGMPAAMLDLDHNSTGNYNFNIQNATFTEGSFNGSSGASVPINIFNGSASGSSTVFQGRIVGNSITGLNNGGFDGIFLNNSGPGNMTALVDSNTITNVAARGIGYGGAQNAAANTANLTITNNTITMPDPNASFGIQVDAMASSGTGSGTVNLTLTGNNVINDTASPDYRVDALRTGATLNMPGYGGGSQDTTAVKAFVAANNKTNGATSSSAEVSVSTGLGNLGHFGNTAGGAATPLPTNLQPLFAAEGGVQASSPTAGETHLTQTELDSVVAAAIGQWALAGASAAQLAALHAVTFAVADLSGVTIGEESTGHITIDIDAAGHGWFVDPTPNDNSEFTHAANAAGTDLFTDPSNAAAGHLDLLTTVTHELGHVLGLDDIQSPADDLMYINLVDGERRMPDAADVAQANDTTVAQAVEAAMPLSAQAAAGTPIVVGTPANDTIDAGHGGNILFGGAGADTFVFGSATPLNAPTPAQITHVADYSAAQGDTFDFSAITSAFHNSSVSDALVVRAVEDASGKFATLQVDHIDPMGLPSAPNWVNVAQLDGAHSGDAVNVIIDNNHSVHLAQIHVDLLV
jgi:VCBS repeat-containing protein